MEDEKRINELLIPESDFQSIGIIYDACKSTCKIKLPNVLLQGFL